MIHRTGCLINTQYQRTHFFHSKVYRVCDRAGYLIGHLGLYGQVTVCKITHLIQQLHNSFLGLLIRLGTGAGLGLCTTQNDR